MSETGAPHSDPWPRGGERRLEPTPPGLARQSPATVTLVSGQAALSVAVIVASRGRPVEVGQLLEKLSSQTLPPAQIILSVSQASDLPPQARDLAEVVSGEAGLCIQRNRALDALDASVDVIAFFDDDYVPRPDTVAAISRLFGEHPSLVAAHGKLLADGINGPGLTFAETETLIEASQAAPAEPLWMVPCEGLYGCNMTFRTRALGAKRFDERLKLYGWQEDIDFSAQFVREGGVFSTNAFLGVHRGVKGARMSGRRFGYSQIVNPAYLVKKGTMRGHYAIRICLQNLAANAVRSLAPEPWVDRRGRLLGNLAGLWSLLRGRIEPERVLDVR